MSLETRGEYELVFFKKLDNEFNKIIIIIKIK